MYVIDTSTLKKVGEFGSKEWIEATIAAAVRILEAAKLPPDVEWALTEHYTCPPARLLQGGRELAGSHIIVKDGKVTVTSQLKQKGYFAC